MRLCLKTTVTAAVLALSLSGAQAQQHDPAVHGPIAKSSVTAAKAANAPSYLFVLSAREAKAKRLRRGYTLLSFNQSNVNQVVMFSDRPSRIVTTITDDELNKLWKEGDDSFEKDPPNAVLSAKGVLPQIVTIIGIQVSQDGVVYRIRPTKPNAKLNLPRRLKDMVLTIDSDPVNITECNLPVTAGSARCTGEPYY